MIVPCNQLVYMVIVDDVINPLDVDTLKTVSIEYNRIEYPPESRIHQNPQTYTDWDDDNNNRLP
jgi:hypothetical protein